MSKYIKYNGDYEKEHYDIQTYNGNEYEMCWPNAGDFHSYKGKHIKGENVQFFKPSDRHPLDIIRSRRK